MSLENSKNIIITTESLVVVAAATIGGVLSAGIAANIGTIAALSIVNGFVSLVIMPATIATLGVAIVIGVGFGIIIAPIIISGCRLLSPYFFNYFPGQALVDKARNIVAEVVDKHSAIQKDKIQQMQAVNVVIDQLDSTINSAQNATKALVQLTEDFNPQLLLTENQNLRNKNSELEQENKILIGKIDTISTLMFNN